MPAISITFAPLLKAIYMIASTKHIIFRLCTVVLLACAVLTSQAQVDSPMNEPEQPLIVQPADVVPISADITPEHGHEAQAEAKEGIDIKKVLFEHVGDAHDWHIFSIGEGEHAHHVSMPLPIIVYKVGEGLKVFSSSNFHHGHETYEGLQMGRSADGIKEVITALDGSKVYDFSITKNVLCLLISVAILLMIIFAVAKRSKSNGTTKAPSGIQNAIEPIITFIRDNVAKPFLGHSYQKYMPLLLTFFFFIWINNLLGLLPFGFNLTGNIAATAFLTLVFFVVMLFSSKKYFWGHIFNPPGVPFGIKLILVPIEFLSIFIKPVALCLRLFANIFAGHTIILCIISLIFIFAKKFGAGAGLGFSLVSVPFTIFMFFIELLVAAIQAFIFTNLVAVFVGQAIEEHHHEEGHGKEGAVAH
jgi:F-type H+-transporting ATPase subunit a